jgi:hypothetical protein
MWRGLHETLTGDEGRKTVHPGAKVRQEAGERKMGHEPVRCTIRLQREREQQRARTMADTHAQDPNAAPLRQQVVEDFGPGPLWYAASLGAIAIIVGLVLGLVLVNN